MIWNYARDWDKFAPQQGSGSSFLELLLSEKVIVGSIPEIGQPLSCILREIKMVRKELS